MFVVLELAEQSAKGIISGVFNIISRPKNQLEAKTFHRAKYAVIRAAVHRSRIDWDSVEEMAGAYAARTLLPQGVAPPTDCRFRAPDLSLFEMELLKYTACELIKRTRMPMYRRQACLIDPDGVCSGMLPPLLRHYTSVRVVTGNTGYYRQRAEEMMEELGAPVMVTDAYTGMEDCVLAIAPFGIEDGARLPCPILLGTGAPLPRHGDVFSELRHVPSKEWREECPGGISPHAFTGALWQFCGLEPENFVGEKLLYNGKQSDLMEAVRVTMQNSGTLSLF